MIDIKNIKLIIWDLDETFWNGTISEGDVSIPQKNIELINLLTDCGVINSICSKNDEEIVFDKLNEHNIKTLFVFPSINWNSKGMRVQEIVSNMQLRFPNVLFIDDNISNIEEVKYYCKDIMTATPEIIDELYEYFLQAEKNDTDRKRLQQYKVLEQKHNEKSKFSTNEDFLFDSNIKIEVDYNCIDYIDRIHDLILRSNQLNFTKLRDSKDELLTLFKDKSVNCGSVFVSDKFGNYGLVGFFAIKDNKLIHFCFSCRTLGMGIEQYIYNYINRPELIIVGEVISDLSSTELPKWITLENKTDSKEEISTVAEQKKQVLIKGPCDLFQIMPYISNSGIIDTDFTHTKDNGIVVESTGHTTHIVNALKLSQKQKNTLLHELDFIDETIFNSSIYKNYKVVVISILSDANLGVYRRKQTGEQVAFLEGYHPLTDRSNWDAYINGEYNSCNKKITKEWLEEFSEKYEFVGINKPEQIVKNLIYIRQHLPKDCVMAVMLGGELYYEKNIYPAYNDRHITHKHINDAIRNVASAHGIKLLDVNKYIVDQSSFYDHFNHYIKPVYYSLAGDILEIINERLDTDFKEASRIKMLVVQLKEIVATLYYKVLKLINRGKLR